MKTGSRHRREGSIGPRRSRHTSCCGANKAICLTVPPTSATSGAMSEIKSICVYCGSGPGTNPAFNAAARRFGRILAEAQIRLVYGGGSAGLMGTLAEAVLDHGGFVTGIIPEFLTDSGHMLMRAQERIASWDR